MADDPNTPTEEKSGSKLPIIAGGAVLIVAVVVGLAVMMMKQGPTIEKEKPRAEYIVQSKMYQLKDGSYLKLAFSIVVDEEKLPTVTEIVEKQSPGRLPAGVTMILGNKGRMDLINGTHKREAFTRDIKKMLEERVFSDFNRRQTAAKDMIEVREVLISDFVTQSG